MSKRQTLRGLVNERLAEAAKEIFVLVERTITEYEEELIRFKEENTRKQQLLDLVLRPHALVPREEVHTPVLVPRVEVHIPLLGPRVEVHTPVLDHELGPLALGPNAEVDTEYFSPGTELSQKQKLLEIPHTQIKEEPLEESIKYEEGQFPEFTVALMKSEEQRTEPKDPQGEDTRGASFSSYPHGRLYTEYGQSDNDTAAHSSTAQIVEEEDHSNNIQTEYRNAAAHNSAQGTNNTSSPETSGILNNENMSSLRVKKQFQCSVCRMVFKTLSALSEHKLIHNDESPSNICFVCNKIFSKSYYLKTHMRIHTGERPYSCSVCHKSFTQKSALDIHRRIHTGERPYGCLICHRRFKDCSSRIRHMRVHTREQPYSCLICGTSFSSNSNLKRHLYNSKTCRSK